MAFKTIEEIELQCAKLGIKRPELTEGVINLRTYEQWTNRGLPSSIEKYYNLLQRLDLLTAQRNAVNEWGVSDNHEV